MHGTAKLARPSKKWMAQLKMHGASQKCMAQLNLQDPAKNSWPRKKCMAQLKMHGSATVKMHGPAKIAWPS